MRSKHQVRRLVVLAAASSVVLTVAGTVAGAEITPQCIRRKLADGLLQWVSSAVFASGRDYLVVVDPKTGQLTAFNETVNRGIRVLLPLGRDGRPGRAAVAFESSEGFTLQLAGSEALIFNRDLRISGQRSLDINQPGPGSAVGSIYDAASVSGWLVGYGSIRRGPTDAASPKAFELGFFQVPQSELPFRADLLLPFDQNKFYLLGYNLVTATEHAGFFLKMDARPELYRVDPGASRAVLLGGLPEPFSEVEMLSTETSGPETASALYAEVAASVLPMGLYGQRDGLFLLGREPLLGGGTRWTIHRLSPEDGRVVGKPAVLPTRAEHLTVVPGEDHWYFIEKGPVEGWAQQKIESVMLLPSAWLWNRASPLRSSSAATMICPIVGV